MLSFRERMLAMFEQTRNAPYVKLLHEESDIPEADPEYIRIAFDEIETHLGYPLADYFRDYFFASEAIALHWDYELDGEEENGGEFRLSNLFNVFTSDDSKLWIDEMSEQEKEFYRKLRPFDDHPYMGDGTMGVFKLEPGVASPEIWFYNVSNKSYKMDLTYNEYVECLIDTRGFFGWQYLFCDIDIRKHYTDLPGELAKMLDVLPRLFPDTNFDKYRQRYEKLMQRKSSPRSPHK